MRRRSLAFDAVDSFGDAVRQQVRLMLVRSARQNGLAPLNELEIERFGTRLVQLIESQGLPPRLRADEMGEPGEMSPERVTLLVAAVLEGSERFADLATVTRQFIKACFYPEFRKCRESYREREDNGSCRRQELDLVRTRISGAHCIDCPYWTALTPEQHRSRLADGWVGERETFVAFEDVFLPEDFRRFRQLVRARAPSA